MYAPVRAGTRGGQGDFSWNDVKDDKDRENYLGHSILAPKGRWQNGRDVTWYNKDKTQAESERAAEIRAIKEREEDALSLALGFTPALRSGASSSANAIPLPPLTAEAQALEKAKAKEVHRAEKEERKRDRATRRTERAEIKSSRKDSRDDGHRSRGREEEEDGNRREGSRERRDSRRDESRRDSRNERDRSRSPRRR